MKVVLCGSHTRLRRYHRCHCLVLPSPFYLPSSSGMLSASAAGRRMHARMRAASKRERQWKVKERSREGGGESRKGSESSRKGSERQRRGSGEAAERQRRGSGEAVVFCCSIIALQHARLPLFPTPVPHPPQTAPMSLRGRRQPATFQIWPSPQLWSLPANGTSARLQPPWHCW